MADGNNTECFTYLTTQQSIGLAFNVETGFFSAVAVVILLMLYARNVWNTARRPPPEGWKFLRTHIDAYLLSLLFADLLHAFGSIMDLKWVSEGHVYCGDYCSAQGAIRNVGSTGVALATMAIAIHTFAVIFFRWIPPRSNVIPAIVISIIWLFLILFVVLEAVTHPNFYTPTPYWCWISADIVPRLVGQYIWLWLSSFVSIVLYILLFFSLRGNVTIDTDTWWNIKFHRAPQLTLRDDQISIGEAQPGSEARSQAMSMLLYPALYTVLVTPLSISRWLGYAMQQENPPRQLPFVVSMVSITVFGLSGLVNVALFMITRPKLLLFDRRPRDTITVRTFSFPAPRRPNGSMMSISPISRDFPDIHDSPSSKPARLTISRSHLSVPDGTDMRMRPLKSIHPLDKQDDDSVSDSEECDVGMGPHAM